MTGVLVVDKPEGPTSHDVVARVRRALQERRIGHTGTLDPLATGVLPLVVGRATRLAVFLSGDDKEYLADVRLGSSTDTYDVTGTRLPARGERPAESVTADDLAHALETFRGTYDQVPPAFSAKKVGGVAAYKLARRSQDVALAPAPVTVKALTLERFEGGLVRLSVTCSAGFYVRSLAHALGERLGCGAHLERLRRTRAGSFTEADAVPLEVVEDEGPRAAARLVQGDRLLTEFPAVVLNERGLRRASHGNSLSAADLEPGQAALAGAGERDSAHAGVPNAGCPPYRLLDGGGALVGIAELRADGLLHPAIVLG
jgi:tRNA pseudouridine55 synthase